MTPGQIRQQTAPIFYLENRFETSERDYDSAANCFWTAKVRSLGKAFRFNLSLEYSGIPRPNWSNLMRWTSAYHSQKTVWGVDIRAMPRAAMRTLNSLRIVAAMSMIVESHKETPWDEVQKLLDPFRDILESVERGWLS